MANPDDSVLPVISGEEIRQKGAKLDAFIDRAKRRIAGHQKTILKMEEERWQGKKWVERALQLKAMEN